MGKNGDSENAMTSNSAKKYVMVIDLAKCKNARKCVEKCRQAHHLPTHHELLKVYLMQEAEEGTPYWMPKPCFQCDDPACVEACPHGASFKTDQGIVKIDYDKCKGCKLCQKACPFSSRHMLNLPFNGDSNHPEHPIAEKTARMIKCDFCMDSVVKGNLPECVMACPSGVIYFGNKQEDLVDNGREKLGFQQMIRERSGYRYGEDTGASPNVYYLPPEA
ncbi:MAG: 4Fe-4S dicluster domain-containing protein [Marinilabiliales bacterium]|nr:4Fe-4S dicluster domain-containing protein [Marinilabiliales bacterium]